MESQGQESCMSAIRSEGRGQSGSRRQGELLGVRGQVCNPIKAETRVLDEASAMDGVECLELILLRDCPIGGVRTATVKERVWEAKNSLSQQAPVRVY